MADEVKPPANGETSTGQKTLATVGNMPQQPVTKAEVVKYATSLGLKTIDEIKALLKSGELHLSHLGDDALALLEVAEKKVSGWGSKQK